MTHKEYNGWTNYETWVVKLWMDNDEGSYRSFGQMAEESYRNATGEPEERLEDAASALAEELKAAHEENYPLDSGNVFDDLLSASMSEVNWYEIAESMLEDVEKEAEVA